MTSLKATVRGRRVELDVPADWPDGIEVEIHPLNHGVLGDADEMSPVEIARALAAMDQVQPFDMSEEEEASWESQRRARREEEKAKFAEHAEELRRAWE